MLKRLSGWLSLILILAGCSFTVQQDPTASPSPLPTIALPTPTETPTLTPEPSLEPTITETPAPTETLPPTEPPPPTNTPYPTTTPYPQQALFLNDRWQQVEVNRNIAEGLSTNWLAFISYNDGAANATEPASQIQTLYLVEPTSLRRVSVLEIPASVGDRIFWSPSGAHVAYFVEPALDENGQSAGGLYMLDLRLGLNYRLFDIPNLNPRSIPGHTPAWSGDGRLMSVALPTEYATDIFAVDASATTFRNLTNHPSYDLWPAFSPNGLWLAFVSDRNICPSWTPGDEDTCDQPGALPPTQGNLFVLNMNTGELRQITDVLLNGAPRWITNTELVFSTGGGNALATSSDIWIADIEAGTAVQVSDPGILAISEHWNNDASRVVYQRAGAVSDILLSDSFGTEINVTTAYTFPRYGLAADWSPDNQYIAFGGRNGQCPYGILVTDATLGVVTEPARNLLACDPTYAPQGRYLAFTGIRPGITTDGRLDIYLANQNGLGARNITTDIRGQIRLLGWVGPTPAQPEE